MSSRFHGRISSLEGGELTDVSPDSKQLEFHRNGGMRRSSSGLQQTSETFSGTATLTLDSAKVSMLTLEQRGSF